MQIARTEEVSLVIGAYLARLSESTFLFGDKGDCVEFL
jgi:hypothetical protein